MRCDHGEAPPTLSDSIDAHEASLGTSCSEFVCIVECRPAHMHHMQLTSLFLTMVLRARATSMESTTL